ncbi:MAG: hypothetical protein Ct9H300mP14_01720 [Gammaproteobacteria bacterium]|nr:MAG: hypothetical protein Ct9H300mP14_01720 [Gammaproteobacteria bacterium]
MGSVYSQAKENNGGYFYSALSSDIEAFVSARDWHQFHSPKNLSMALSVEAAELVEHFQWLTPDQSEDLSGISVKR